eukprot:364496-Chlamydomonas_euryale.AAC.6
MAWVVLYGHTRAHEGHAIPRLRRPSPSLRCTGDQRPHRAAAAAACQRPHRLPARVTGMGRRPDGTLHPTARICVAAGVPRLMHIFNAARLIRLGHIARMPDASVVKQLLFADGLIGLGGVVGRLRCTWQDMAVTALHPVLTSWLAGWGWYGVAQDPPQWRALRDSVQPTA